MVGRLGHPDGAVVGDAMRHPQKRHRRPVRCVGSLCVCMGHLPKRVGRPGNDELLRREPRAPVKVRTWKKGTYRERSTAVWGEKG